LARRPAPQAVRLWMHECERVFRDRLVSEADASKFDEFRAAVTKKFFEDLPGGMAALEERPILFTSFVQARVLRLSQENCFGWVAL
jgi:hypothetical protein